MIARPLSVIVPVYNAFAEALLCLDSILRHSPPGIRILVVDDASPDGDFASVIPRSQRMDPRVVVTRNPVNRGFVGTCNRAMLILAGNDDVILLNSDTEVTPRWIEKLARAAYSRTNIGTVTPMTNNGVICSFPRFCEDNELLAGFSADELSNLIEEVSVHEYPELPTAIGFCMYIRREVIDRIGGFDEDAFGKGYGEENDFCCRAQAAGYVDILDDATFIYHKGGMSFLGEKAELCRRNEIVLRERHPGYYPRVSEFCGSFPVWRIHARIFNELTRRWAPGKPHVLHILHNGPYKSRRHAIGGTELHVRDLIENIPEFGHWTLVPGIDCYYLSTFLHGVEREIRLPRNTPLRELISAEAFNVVHLHHTIAFDSDELEEALAQHEHYIVSTHDYSYVCPRNFLFTTTGFHCSGHECATVCGFKMDDIAVLRARSRRLFHRAHAVVRFSKSSKEYYERLLSLETQWREIPHGSRRESDTQVSSVPEAPGSGVPFRVLFIGHLAPHKGGQMIKEVTRTESLGTDMPVEWHILGELYDNVDDRVVFHGKYEREDLPGKIAKIHPHVIAIASLCPETFSLTLDEAWRTGVPVVVSPTGAPAERVRQHNAGWVFDEPTAHSLLQTLAQVASDRPGYERCWERVHGLVLSTPGEMGAKYRELYGEISRRAGISPIKVLRWLQPGLVVENECLHR